jgi:hypothetical protein
MPYRDRRFEGCKKYRENQRNKVCEGIINATKTIPISVRI